MAFDRGMSDDFNRLTEAIRELSFKMDRNAEATERAAGERNAQRTGQAAERVRAAADAARAEFAQGIRGGPAAAGLSQAFQDFRQQAFQGTGVRPGGAQRAGIGGLFEQGASFVGGRGFAPLAVTYALFDTLKASAAAEGAGETYDARERLPVFGGYFKGKREFDSRAAVLAASSQLDRRTMSGYLRYLGTTSDPFSRNLPIGAETGRLISESMLPYERSGVNLTARTEMARLLIKEHGGAGTAEAAKNIAPFIEDPLTRGATLREFYRKSNNQFTEEIINPALAGIGRKGLDPMGSRLDNSWVVSGVVSHGLAATYSGLSSLLKDDPDKMARLQDFALRFSDRMKTAGLRTEIAGSNVGIADARFARVMAGGAEIDDPAARSARQQEIRARQAVVKALEEQVATLKNAGPLNLDAQAKLKDYSKQLEEAKTSLAQLAQQDRSMIAARQVARLNVATSVSGLRAEREAYSLAPGKVSVSLTAQATATAALVRKNDEIARDSKLKPEERDAARIAAEEARNRLINIHRAQDYQKYGIPQILTEGYTARTLSRAGSRLGEGAGLRELTPLLAEGVRGSRRALEQARQELTFRQGHRDRYSIEDIEESRNRAFEAEQRLRAATRLQAYAPHELGMAELSRRGMILEGRITARRSMLLGPEANRADVYSTVRLMDERRKGLLSEAGEADRQKDTERARDLRAQAETLRYQRSTALITGLSDFSPSARSRLTLGQNDLALGLAQMNTMAPVPPSLYRQRIGLLNAQIGDIQAQMQGAPDAVKANLFPQYSALMLQRGEAQQALRMGNMGRLFSLSIGAPNGTNFSLGMESLAGPQEYARQTGRPLPEYLGGAYTGYGENPTEVSKAGMDFLREMNADTLGEAGEYPEEGGAPLGFALPAPGSPDGPNPLALSPSRPGSRGTRGARGTAPPGGEGVQALVQALERNNRLQAEAVSLLKRIAGGQEARHEGQGGPPVIQPAAGPAVRSATANDPRTKAANLANVKRGF